MSYVVFVRVGVLPPTPSTLYLAAINLFIGLSPSWWSFPSMGRFMIRLSIALRSSVAKISRATVIPS